MERNIVILTESSKDGGLCVAGVDFNTGKWIRLVKNDGEQITRNIMKYADGSSVEILDCVRVNTIGSAATPIQSENVYLNTATNIKRIKKISLRELLTIHNLENHRNILGSYNHVIRSNAEGVGHSLELVKVNNAVLHRVPGSNGYDKSKLEFDYNNTHYNNMSVTDPDYYYVEDGTSFGDAILVISLANNNYKDFGYFKIIAKIFRLNS
ncbi:MAG: hypothetical protein AB7V48_01885 [Sedimentibacter sp.]